MNTESFSDKVIYQIYPKSFKDSNGDGFGDLGGILEQLDYLADLGVDYLWLTPVFPSPQRDNGYDVADYCAIDSRFGTMAHMEELITESGRRGMGIMLDMVFNHTSTSHPWFQKALAGEKEYQDYYMFREGTPDRCPTNWQSKFGGPAWEYVPALGKWYLHLFDVTQADLNWDNPRVREELKAVIRFWKDKGVRGFRFDVINLVSKPEILQNDPAGDGRRFYSDGPRIHDYLKELVRDTGIGEMVTVGEMSSTTLDNCIRYSSPGEQELSMCFNFHHLKTDYQNGDKWSLMEPDRMALKKLFQKWQLGMEEGGGWNALFWCNHDQPRIVSRLGDEGQYRKESAKMLAAAIHLMRGTPYIFQGEELGMTNAHYQDISQYRDVESLNYYQILLNQGKTRREALKILAARSRDNSRTPMQWSAKEHAGFTTGTPWIGITDNYQTINVENQKHDSDSVHAFYKRLIALRKEKKVISQGRIAFLEEDNPDVLAYERILDGGTGDNQEGGSSPEESFPALEPINSGSADRLPADPPACTRQQKTKKMVVLCNLTARDLSIPAAPAWAWYQKLLGNYHGTPRIIEDGADLRVGDGTENRDAHRTGDQTRDKGEHKISEGTVGTCLQLRPFEVVVLEDS